jgi:3-hydroxybutyryl-CoA dehydrogenase
MNGTPIHRASGIACSSRDLERVAVLGCGDLGSALVGLCLAAGLHVTALKLLPGDLDETRARLLERARRVAGGSCEQASERLELSRDFALIRNAQIVIEAAAENVCVKQNVLADAEPYTLPGVPLFTTTRSLRLSELAEALASSRSLLGLHFAGRVEQAGVVELGTTPETETSAIAVARAFCALLGKTPLLLGDDPGYVVNRLQIAHVLHAIELVERGTASVEDIDQALTLAGVAEQGPLATADELGLDILLATAKNLYSEHADARYACPGLLRRLVRQGALGRKTGAGFYVYGAERTPNPAASPFAEPELMRNTRRASAA